MQCNTMHAIQITGDLQYHRMAFKAELKALFRYIHTHTHTCTHPHTHARMHTHTHAHTHTHTRIHTLSLSHKNTQTHILKSFKLHSVNKKNIGREHIIILPFPVSTVTSFFSLTVNSLRLSIGHERCSFTKDSQAY